MLIIPISLGILNLIMLQHFLVVITQGVFGIAALQIGACLAQNTVRFVMELSRSFQPWEPRHVFLCSKQKEASFDLTC
jgi:hypothetical protein